VTVAPVAGAGNNVAVCLVLEGDELGDELRVVREVGIHDDDEVAGNELQAMHIGSTEAELASAWLKDDV